MKKKAGILFIVKHAERFEVWLGKRVRPPYEGYWSSVAGNIRAGEDPWDCACREAREELNVDVNALLGLKSAKKEEPIKYTIPFLSHITFYVLLLNNKGIIDDHPRFVGNFNDSNWYPVDAPPQKSHLSIHFCLGVVEQKKNI